MILEMTLTISVISGSSGLGSDINNCIDVKIVEIFKDGFHAPYKNKIQ